MTKAQRHHARHCACGTVYPATPRIQDAMSELLGTLGFGKMAEAVKIEEDRERLSRYARIIVRQTRDERAKMELCSRFRLLNLL